MNDDLSEKQQKIAKIFLDKFLHLLSENIKLLGPIPTLSMSTTILKKLGERFGYLDLMQHTLNGTIEELRKSLYEKE